MYVLFEVEVGLQCGVQIFYVFDEIVYVNVVWVDVDVCELFYEEVYGVDVIVYFVLEYGLVVYCDVVFEQFVGGDFGDLGDFVWVVEVCVDYDFFVQGVFVFDDLGQCVGLGEVVGDFLWYYCQVFGGVVQVVDVWYGQQCFVDFCDLFGVQLIDVVF